LQHLVNAVSALTDAAVEFQSLGEGIDTQSATGRLMLGILASFAEFERERIRERVMAGLQRARTQGKRLGRPKGALPLKRLESVAHLSVGGAAEALRVSRATVKRWRRGQKSLAATA
jgi:DNA invertase Pin-like site-specific DNA recombinase